MEEVLCPGPGRRILVAEDDAELRGLIAGALRRDGHDVVQAADGTEILELLAATISDGVAPFDLIVTDVRMPGWTGLDLLAGLRNHAFGPPVVLMTAFGDERLHASARRLGAVATLDKPFELDVLRALVGAALGG
jgi:DNA-binding response OmpR family regulator